jgi:hypothetical protein
MLIELSRIVYRWRFLSQSKGRPRVPPLSIVFTLLVAPIFRVMVLRQLNRPPLRVEARHQWAWWGPGCALRGCGSQETQVDGEEASCCVMGSPSPTEEGRHTDLICTLEVAATATTATSKNTVEGSVFHQVSARTQI